MEKIVNEIYEKFDQRRKVYEAQIADAEDWRLLEATAEYGKYRNR